MSKAFWAVSLILVFMVFGILLMASSSQEQARTNCELEDKRYGNRTVKVWDCD